MEMPHTVETTETFQAKRHFFPMSQQMREKEMGEVGRPQKITVITEKGYSLIYEIEVK
jgi:hypothetical protein